MAWRPPPPGVRRRGTRCPTRATWASGQDWGQSGRGRAAVERPKPAAAPATGLSTSSGPRERRRPAGRGRGTDSARRARRPLHPARKSCRPVPPIAGDAPSGGGHRTVARRPRGAGCLREGARSYAKDADGNYLTVCQAAESVENGLRSGAVGNFISITVLSVLRCPSVGARPAVFSGQVDCVPIRAARRGPGIQPGMISRRSSSRLASAELLRGLNCLSQTNRVTPGVDRLFEQMIEVRAEARAGPARRCGLRPGVPRRPARRRRSARSSSWPAGWFACDGRPRSDVRVERHRPDAEFAAQFGHQRVAVGHPRRLRGVVRDSARASCRTAPPVRIPVLRGRRGA